MFDDSHFFDGPDKETREKGSYECLLRIEQKLDKLITLLGNPPRQKTEDEQIHDMIYTYLNLQDQLKKRK